jgi:hypothetical protein
MQRAARSASAVPALKEVAGVKSAFLDNRSGPSALHPPRYLAPYSRQDSGGQGATRLASSVGMFRPPLEPAYSKAKAGHKSARL